MADALLVTPSFLPGKGGIESHLAQLCAELAPRIAVLAPSHRDGEPIPANLPYESIGYEGHMAWPSRKVADAITLACDRQGTHKVLFGTPWPLLLLGPQLTARGLRYAVMVHGAELIAPGAIPGTSGRIASALSDADLILPVSHHTAAKLRRLLDRKHMSHPPIAALRPRVDLDLFHPGVSTSAVRRHLVIPDGAPVVLSFGRLVPRKGTDRLIAAMREVRRSIPEAILVIAGTGPEEKKLRGSAALDEGVIFAGRVPDEHAPALFATADVFVLAVADRWLGLEVEGLGVVLLEAGAAATPAVTGRSGGTPEAVIDGETGFVIDAHESDQLEAKVKWLLEHPVDANRMGVWGHAHVCREFSGAPLPPPLLHWLERS
ncbi:MAG: phosphatidyl-myo-inositol dimannoside synthase [Actinomycetota bacterium]|jgi:phosphatidylinositol alpha-1,6-mannosyltransferase|nr:phosphatidyl-myo-inositol dimannoside synthase [Actinomycetota bacterium]